MVDDSYAMIQLRTYAGYAKCACALTDWRSLNTIKDHFYISPQIIIQSNNGFTFQSNRSLEQQNLKVEALKFIYAKNERIYGEHSAQSKYIPTNCFCFCSTLIYLKRLWPKKEIKTVFSYLILIVYFSTIYRIHRVQHHSNGAGWRFLYSPAHVHPPPPPDPARQNPSDPAPQNPPDPAPQDPPPPLNTAPLS